MMVIGEDGAPHGVIILTVASALYPSNWGIPVPPMTAMWILPVDSDQQAIKSSCEGETCRHISQVE